MEVDRAISKRRSVRKYANTAPQGGAVTKILKAGMWAPSGLNNQPWKFRVVRGPEKDGLARFTEYGAVIKRAPVAVCVFLDKKASYNREKDIMAIGACVQNMLLKAFGLGLGTCWLGEILNRKEEVRRYLKADRGNELMAVVVLGYPSGRGGKGRRRPLKSFIIRQA
ncbi:MAG: nitroreductase [Candidatus Omnitrophota bacterium]